MAKWLLLLMLMAAPAWAANVIIFDPGDPDVPNAVKAYRRSVNTPDFRGRSDVLVNPDVSAIKVSNTPLRHWKVSGESIVEMTQAEKDLIDANTILTAQRRAQVQAKLNTLFQNLSDWDTMTQGQKNVATKVILQWMKLRDQLGNE